MDYESRTPKCTTKEANDMKWIECNTCDAEFKVVSDCDDPIEFCPFCGESIEPQDEHDNYYDEDLEE